jgi:manganese/zinc/iron transport system substrate-binding protein
MKYSAFVAVLLLLLGLVSCSDSPGSEPGDRIVAVATTGMIADLVENIGGDLVAVTSLMGPGTDPHLYRASAGDVAALQNADIIFLNGLDLEAKMGDVLERMAGSRPVHAVAAHVPENRLLVNEEGVYDPHIWFDVELWQDAAVVVLDALQEFDPGNSEAYQANYAAYDSQLADLQVEVVESLSAIPGSSRVLITSHDAFNYFGRAYGFEVMGLQGISTVSEAGTRDIQNLADMIAERRIRAIFTESSVSDRNIKALQAAVESRSWDVRIGEELFSDAMGSAGTPEGTYLGMVRHNVRSIVEAFGE